MDKRGSPHYNHLKYVETTPQPSISKLEVTLDADLMSKLKTAGAANKTPSEIAELLRQQLR
ncbi:MAG: hypothetical protein QMD13_01960 [Candidatus Bathyarchaeia archaeon]|nr:hypothetical protein [Candidatus Bathyarchaeia archaeon]